MSGKWWVVGESVRKLMHLDAAAALDEGEDEEGVRTRGALVHGGGRLSKHSHSR